MGNRNRKQNKRDNLEVKGKLNSKEFKQNPNWYFKDAVQADVLSRIQMNAFGALTKLGNYSVPTVWALYANPCPGVTPYEVNVDPEFNAKGVNRAAQKLWYILTCKSGRAAGYTKADVAILLLGMGAMIETYEFIRRAFGIAYTYNQRNRALPNMLYQAMCVDMDDYQKNAADYLKRMNSLMAIMNQLPMPGNIAWFAKCQDIYQNIYMDYPAEMAQLYVISPSTTWILEENDGFIGGSYLRTVDMCVQHADSSATNEITYGKASGNWLKSNDGKMYGVANRWAQTDRFRKLGEYIDVFEEQINNLLFSSSFSQIYSDLLRAFDSGTLTRWTFDYVDEKYIVSPVFDDNRLWMFHNATIYGGIEGISRSEWQSKWATPPVYGYIFQHGTPCNDVYQWASTDTVLYNPSVTTYMGSYANSAYNIIMSDSIVDFPSDAPTVEQRIEYTRYMSTSRIDAIEHPDNHNGTTEVMLSYAFNQLFPDHWFELGEVLCGMNDKIFPTADEPFYDRTRFVEVYNSAAANNTPQMITKFHHGPNMAYYTPNGSDVELSHIIGELTSWAYLSQEWFAGINDMIYVDLFDVR